MNITNNLIFDSHCHLYLEDYNLDREAILEDCAKEMAGWINIGIDLKSSKQCYELTKLYANKSRFSAGVHPHDSKDFKDEDLKDFHNLWQNNLCSAIGEIGLDYFYEHSNKEIQKTVFKKLLLEAKKLNKPCIFHVREAFNDFFQILDEVAYYNGIVHCFTGNQKEANSSVKRNLYLSFGGILTFKKSTELREIAQNIPLDKIILETDSPYLAPTPFRGKRNHPKYVSFVAKKLAEIKNLPLETILKKTNSNAKTFFNLEYL